MCCNGNHAQVRVRIIVIDPLTLVTDLCRLRDKLRGSLGMRLSKGKPGNEARSR